MHDCALIGRAPALHVLRAHVDRTRTSHGGLLFVTGEPGIGKTSLVRHAAQEAARQGLCVLYGSCFDADGAPGYWPWVQVVRRLGGAVCDEAGWQRATEEAGRVLAVLSDGAAAADGVDRFHLCDLVATLLAGASRSRPVLIVLEDLHWADPASVDLLEFVAQHAWYERLLVVGTYRDAEVRRTGHALRERTLLSTATTLPLTGLTAQGVGELFGRTVGAAPEPGLAEEVHRRTGGNPFFVEETARLWSAGQPLTALSPGVRAAVHRRLSLLSEPAVRLLGAAAVLGRRFGRDDLARTAGLPRTRADGLLAEAVDARLAEPDGDERVLFVHDLIRETLYAGLDAPARCRLHAAAARALTARTPGARPPHPSDLAHHAHHAHGELDAGQAVDLLVAAARDAAGRLAHEEAVRHCERALERLGPDDPGRAVPITLDLAQALQLLGEHERSWLAFEDAAAQARTHADPVLLGRVALTVCEADPRGDATGLQDRVLGEAHRALTGPARAATVPGGTPPGARAPTGPPPGGTPPAGTAPTETAPGATAPPPLTAEVARAVAGAARLAGDDDALHVGVWAGVQVLWGPETARERAELTAELMQVSRRRGDRWMEHIAMSLRWVTLLELGDPGYLRDLHTLATVARASGSPRMRLTALIDRSVVHTFMGRFAEAEELLARILALSGTHANYHQYFRCHHHWATSLLQGRPDDVRAAHTALRRSDHPNADLLRSLTALELGGEAPGPVGDGPDEDTVQGRALAPLLLRHRAQSAAAQRSPERCAEARAALAPYRGRWLVSLLGWDISGPAALWTGLLDAAEERWDTAVEEFSEARRTADLLHARPWSVRARVELGAALLARGAPGDADTALGLLRDAEREGERLGMVHLAERARRTAPAVPAPRPPQPVENTHEFTRTGKVWRLRYAGRVVHVPDTKGLRDLRVLLGQPRTPVSAARLLAPDGGALVTAAHTLGADPALDDEAKRRYRRRLEQLDEEIDRATTAGDGARAEEYAGERTALVEELRRAAGLGSRTRRLGDIGERARKNVTARIRDTLRKLDTLHPELAAHLRATVSTGTSCCYTPDREIDWCL